MRPSGAGQTVHCPASVSMQELFAHEGTHQITEEGTAGHWGSEKCLKSYFDPSGSILLASDLIGQTAPNDVTITEEIADSIDIYITNILATVQQEGMTINDLHIEELVKIQRLHAECEGTPDVWAFNEKTGVLTVWDLKLGYGIVEAFENWQMICYAIGILDQITSGNALAADNHIRVRLRIVQPRAYHDDSSVRDWNIPAIDLRGYANTLQHAFAIALKPNPFTKSGQHCKHCSAIIGCRTAQRAAANGIDVTDKMNIQVLPPHALKYQREILLRAIDAAEFQLEALNGQIESLIKSGQTVDGLDLDNPEGRLNWTIPPEQVIAVGDAFGVDLRNIKPKTPTQSKKLIDESVINMYAERSKGKTKIVNSDNTKAAKIFGKS